MSFRISHLEKSQVEFSQRDINDSTLVLIYLPRHGKARDSLLSHGVDCANVLYQPVLKLAKVFLFRFACHEICLCSCQPLKNFLESSLWYFYILFMNIYFIFFLKTDIKILLKLFLYINSFHFIFFIIIILFIKKINYTWHTILVSGVQQVE